MKIVSNDNLGIWFDSGNMQSNKVNPKLPIINIPVLTTVPTTTGNTTHLNEIVTGSDNQVYFIDYSGDAILLKPTLRTINGNTVTGSGNIVTPVTTVVSLAANSASTSTTLTNVAGMSFSVLAGKSYKIEFFGNRTSSALTNGARINLTSTSTGFLSGSWKGAISATAAVATDRSFTSTINVPFVITASNPTLGAHYVKLDAFYTATTAGTLQLQWASEVAASTSTLLAGSSLVITQLN